jgi:6-phosphogluconolactonase
VCWFPSRTELVQAAASDWLDWFRSLNRSGQAPVVALSGGRIAKVFFEAANQVFADGAEPLGKAHFFWADERCVPQEHPDSNFGLAWTHLLKPRGVPESRMHRVRGELDPDEAARVVARELCECTGTLPGSVPVLNLVLLGMGEDGHVASLFPGESEVIMGSPECYRSVRASKPPPQRVTLSYGVLIRAEQVWVLASGSGKEAALRASIKFPDSTPLGRVLRARFRTRIYTDVVRADVLAPGANAG